jgi:endogenous inhibitor of DNA gyrase (YacG/DUF329 family)
MKFYDKYHPSTKFSDGKPQCPHCGTSWQPDQFPLQDCDETETECPNCEKPVRIYASMSFRFYTSQQCEDVDMKQIRVSDRVEVAPRYRTIMDGAE